MSQFPEGYIRVPSVFLQAEEPMKIDLYLFMPVNNRMIHYQKKGETFPVDKLMEVMKASSSVVLVKENECKQAMESFNDDLSDSISESGGGEISEETSKKAASVMKSMVNPREPDIAVRKDTAQKVLEDSAGLAQRVVNQFKGANFKAGMTQLLKSIKNDENSLEAHQRHVASLCVLAFLALKEGTAAEASDIAMAGLVHDVGMKENDEAHISRHVLGIELLGHIDPGFTDVSNPKTNLRHVEQGVALLKNLGTAVTDGGMKVIAQHHENMDGSGPWGLKGERIIKPARLLHIVDDVVCLLNCKDRTFDIISALDALSKINGTQDNPKFYDPQMLAKLQTAITGA